MNADLQARLTEYVRAGDIPAVLWAFEAEIRLNAACEMERQALREFVKAMDAYEQAGLTRPWTEYSADRTSRFYAQELREMITARQRLATDHNLPLPGDQRTGADAEDEDFGNCDICGEPLMFRSMSTCASCVHELQG